MKQLRTLSLVAFLGVTAALACNDATSSETILVLAPPSLTFQVCQERLVSASISGQSASAVVFESANPAVATVSATGVVRGVQAGTTRVVAWMAENSRVRDSSDVVVTPGGPCPLIR